MRLKKLILFGAFATCLNLISISAMSEEKLRELFTLVKRDVLTEEEAFDEAVKLKEEASTSEISDEALFELFLLVKKGVLTEEEAITAAVYAVPEEELLDLFLSVKKGELTEKEATKTAARLKEEHIVYSVPDDKLADLFSLIKKGVLTEEEAIKIAAGLNEEAPIYIVSEETLLELFRSVEQGYMTESEAIVAASKLKEEVPPYVVTMKNLKAFLTGRLHMQYDALDNDADESSQNGFYFRRVRLGVDAELFDDFYAKIVAAFGGNDDATGIENAEIGWNYNSKTEFSVGYTKVPFGYYEVKSSARIKTVERSIANRYFVEGDGLRFAGRQTGIFAEGDLEKGFSYAAALVSSDPSNDRNDAKVDNSNGLGLFGRLQWKYELKNKAKDGEKTKDYFLIGVDLGTKQEGSEFAGGSGDLSAYGLHAIYNTGNFNISGELLNATVEDVETGNVIEDADVYGFTLMPAYMVTDNVELVAAYSIIDTDNADLLDADDLVRRSNVKSKYSEGDSYYLGFNYFIFENDLKLSGGYEITQFEDSTGEEVEIDGVRFRLQILF